VSPRLGQAERSWGACIIVWPSLQPPVACCGQRPLSWDTWRLAGSRNRACRVSRGQLGGTQGQQGPWPLGTASKIAVRPQGHVVQQFGVPRDIKLLNCVFMELIISVSGGTYIISLTPWILSSTIREPSST